MVTWLSVVMTRVVCSAPHAHPAVDEVDKSHLCMPGKTSWTQRFNERRVNEGCTKTRGHMVCGADRRGRVPTALCAPSAVLQTWYSQHGVHLQHRCVWQLSQCSCVWGVCVRACPCPCVNEDLKKLRKEERKKSEKILAHAVQLN